MAKTRIEDLARISSKALEWGLLVVREAYRRAKENGEAMITLDFYCPKDDIGGYADALRYLGIDAVKLGGYSSEANLRTLEDCGAAIGEDGIIRFNW